MSTPPDTADRVPPGANPADSHIQSSTPSSLARSPVGSTAPLPIACACASGTPRHESCPPESTLSDGSFLASSVLGATGASSCAISSPTSASLPGAAGAAPSLSRGCPPVHVQSQREQLADVPRASRCRLLRRILRLFPRRRSPHGGRALLPMRRGRTTRHRLRPSRHHGRGPLPHGRIRHRDRPRWRPRRSRPRQGHRQGWGSRLRPPGPSGSRSLRLASGHAMRLPLRHPQLLGSQPRRRYWYRRGRRCRR